MSGGSGSVLDFLGVVLDRVGLDLMEFVGQVSDEDTKFLKLLCELEGTKDG